jgi:integrase
MMAKKVVKPVRGAISFTTRGDRIEATYNVPAKDLPPGSKRKRITAQGSTHAEAQRRLLSKLAEANIRARSNPAAGGPTFGEFLDEWFEDYVRFGVQESTMKIYQGHINTYIKPNLGHFPLESMTINDVKVHFWDKVIEMKKVKDGVETDEPLLGDFALNNLMRTLRMSVEAASEKYETRIKRLSERYFKKRKVSRPESDSEVGEAAKRLRKLFYEEMDRGNPLWSHFMLVLLGLRQSERLGLQVKSVVINSEKAVLRVYQQLDFSTSKGGWYLKDTTKNGAPREIKLYGDFLEAMKKRLEIREKWSQQPNWNPDPKFADLLFLGEGGKLITRRQDTPMWHSLSLGMRGHLARHITGHLLAEDGVSEETAKTILGHRSDAYLHYYRLISTDSAGRELETRYRPGRERA